MNKFVLITGASRGLGYRIAEKFAQEGHHLILTARNEESLKKAKGQLLNLKPDISIEIRSANLANQEDIYLLLEFIHNNNLPLEGLINNAGIYPYKPFLVSKWEEIITTINLNLTGAILLSQGIIREMLPNGGGKIINICSDVAKRPQDNMSPYAASKYGLMGFSRSLSKEFRSKGIYVSAVSPGIINNNETVEPDIDKGMLHPVKIAEIVYFIYSMSHNINFDDVEFHPLMQDF